MTIKIMNNWTTISIKRSITVFDCNVHFNIWYWANGSNKNYRIGISSSFDQPQILQIIDRFYTSHPYPQLFSLQEAIEISDQLIEKLNRLSIFI